MMWKYPLMAEDAMKLLDKAFDKAVAMTKPVQDLAAGLKSCAEGLEKLAMNLAVVAHNQAVHHQMIMQMWNVNQLILRKLNEHALDTSLPEVKPTDTKKDGKDKPN